MNASCAAGLLILALMCIAAVWIVTAGYQRQVRRIEQAQALRRWIGERYGRA